MNYRRVGKMDRKIFRYCDLHNLEIVSYENGNHITYLLSDGTRIRATEYSNAMGFRF